MKAREFWHHPLLTKAKCGDAIPDHDEAKKKVLKTKSEIRSRKRQRRNGACWISFERWIGLGFGGMPKIGPIMNLPKRSTTSLHTVHGLCK